MRDNIFIARSSRNYFVKIGPRFVSAASGTIAPIIILTRSPFSHDFLWGTRGEEGDRSLYVPRIRRFSNNRSCKRSFPTTPQFFVITSFPIFCSSALKKLRLVPLKTVLPRYIEEGSTEIIFPHFSRTPHKSP